jgi:hypothetical protein
MSNLTVGQHKVVNGVCTGIGIACAVATPFLVTEANKKANVILENYCFQNEPLKVRMKYTWKCYIPTALVMGVGLTAGIINGVNTHRLGTALTSEIASHALSIVNSNEVKEKIFKSVKEKYGLDVEQEMRDTGVKKLTEGIQSQNQQEIAALMTPEMKASGKMLIRDDIFGHVFRGSMEDVKSALNEINMAISMGQDRDLSDFYQILNLPYGSIAPSLGPRQGELLELTRGLDYYEGEPCEHFGFANLDVLKM